MLRYGVTYVLTLIIFGALDAMWLGFISAAMYREALGDTLLEKFRIAPAIAFYLLNIVGLMVFVVPSSPGPVRWQQVFLFGALYGVFTYATYDLTNYATLKAFTLRLTLTDITWGAFVSATATTLAVLLTAMILKK